jgi:hypothetical protein
MIRRVAIVSVAVVCVWTLGVAPASAHRERETFFPEPPGEVPTYRDPVQAPSHVVCKDDSAERISALRGRLRGLNQRLLAQCRFEHIQEAVDAVTEPDTTIYVLPGVYREEPSRAAPSPECAPLADRMLSYAEQVACPHLQNLIAVFGDETPTDGDTACDGRLCGLQIEGTGATAEDVIVDGGFDDHGEFDKHIGIRADRADGFYVRNLTTQRFGDNGVYVIETDGFVIDGVVGRWNARYGFLTFTVDHGLYTDCEAYGNGDSGVYPGSAADHDGERFAVEITGCRSHHNTLGYSGTSGNSVYAHDNDFHSNMAGAAMDSLFGGHPGLPQDFAVFEGNRIYSNNVNYYDFIRDGTCDLPPAEWGIEDGTVCPVADVPVGTGLLLAGGNDNSYLDNEVFDNWRFGFMQFWVPAPLRGENDPALLRDTSHRNRYLDNQMGGGPGGERPNGVDFWWDGQGDGNCWEGNTSASGTVTTDPGELPGCDAPSGGGPHSAFGDPEKIGWLLSCTEDVFSASCGFADTPPPPPSD